MGILHPIVVLGQSEHLPGAYFLGIKVLILNKAFRIQKSLVVHMVQPSNIFLLLIPLYVKANHIILIHIPVSLIGKASGYHRRLHHRTFKPLLVKQ